MLKQGSRRYVPLVQPTVQQMMIDTISDGPTTVILLGAHTNFAIFLMTCPELKKNVEHIYVMGGGVRSKNPVGCCLKSSTSCEPSGQCGVVGNLFTGYMSNPYAEFNIFVDPFAAYQVHSDFLFELILFCMRFNVLSKNNVSKRKKMHVLTCRNELTIQNRNQYVQSNVF
jgi:inosine-uridine nucleoside N-ribohydrolase